MRCAVLGDPIGHSLSPVIHRAAYEALGLDGWQYDAVQVPSGGLAEFVAGLDPAEWRGLSLTMPLKREVLPLLDTQDDWVRLAAVCNTVVIDEDGRRHGLNTDVTGALMVLGEHDDLPVERAVVLGGGATAASVLLRARRARDDRTPRSWSATRRGRRRPCAWCAAIRAARRSRCARSTTSRRAGSTPTCWCPPCPPPRRCRSCWPRSPAIPLVFDVVYEPWPTPLARAAQRSGHDGPQRARPAGRPGGQPGGGDDRTLRRPGRRDAPGRGGRPGVEARRVTDLYPATAAVTAVLGLVSGPLVPWLIGRLPEPERRSRAGAPRSPGDPEEPKEPYADIAALPEPRAEGGGRRRRRRPACSGWPWAGRGRCSSCCRWCRSRWRWPSSTGGPACCPAAWSGRPWA